MNWIIESKPVDTYEISPTDTQHEYLVYVKDEAGRNIDGALAYVKKIEKRLQMNSYLSIMNTLQK